MVRVAPPARCRSPSTSRAFRRMAGWRPAGLTPRAAGGGRRTLLALCGYYPASGGGAMTDLLAQMLASNDSVLRLANETVGNLSFLYPNAARTSAADATVSCVLARPAWKPDYATGRMEISTPSARMPG